MKAGACLIFLAFAAVIYAQKQNDGPEQPLPYSHKLHLALKLQCRDCHVNPDPGDRMTFPATAKCMACHQTIAKDKPAIRKLAEYAKTGEPIPWVRVYAVSAGVYWNHRSHVEAGGKCEDCHGDVPSMEVMRKVTNVTSMEGCVSCHRAKKASTGCNFCHDER